MVSPTEGLTMENLNSTVIGFSTPLKHFKGRLISTEPMTRTGQGEGARTFTQISFKFDGVEVLAADVPYHLKTAEIFVSHSTSEQTAWGYLCKSGEDIWGGPYNWKELWGKILELEWTEGHSGRRPNPETKVWESTPFACFTLVSINGKTGGAAVQTPAISEDDLLIGIADGVDAATFNRNALMHDQVKANTPLMQRVLQGGDAMLEAFVLQSKLTRDEGGIYHKILSA
jgi:hypothetical protein